MKHNSGQTLIEVIIAVGLIVLVLTTLASGVAISVRNNRVAKDQAAAKESVREALEWLRSIRDQAGWETFYSISKTTTPYCLKNLPADYKAFATTSNAQCGSNPNNLINSLFKRELTITKVSQTQIRADVTVSWSDGNRNLNSSSTITLYQRR